MCPSFDRPVCMSFFAKFEGRPSPGANSVMKAQWGVQHPATLLLWRVRCGLYHPEWRCVSYNDICDLCVLIILPTGCDTWQRSHSQWLSSLLMPDRRAASNYLSCARQSGTWQIIWCSRGTVVHCTPVFEARKKRKERGISLHDVQYMPTRPQDTKVELV